MTDRGASQDREVQTAGWLFQSAHGHHRYSLIVGMALLCWVVGGHFVQASDASKPSAPQARPHVAPMLVVVPLIQVTSSGQIPFFVLAGPPEALSPNTFIRIRGLPANVTPSEGKLQANGSWDVPLPAAMRLKLSVPDGLAGRIEFVVSLIDGYGSPIIERSSALVAAESIGGPTSRPAKATEETRPANARSQERVDELKQTEPLSKEQALRLEALAKKLEEIRLEAEKVETEQIRLAAEAKKAEGLRVAAEAARKAEEARLAAEARRAEEARLAAEAKKAEELRVATEAARKAEEARLAAEVRKAEEARLAAEAKKVEEVRIAVASQASDNLAIEGRTEKPGTSASATVNRADRSVQAERMITQGERYLAQGNIVVARQYFLRAAESANARGALRLAETHDPQELARLGVFGINPDPALAQKWYERALELGASEALSRLQRLAGQ